MGSVPQREVAGTALALSFPLSTPAPLSEAAWDEELSFPASSAAGLLGPGHPGLRELKTKAVAAHQPHQQQGGPDEHFCLTPRAAPHPGKLFSALRMKGRR